ncbi:MAG: metalloregulator ArsR/SmtB family transcription factor [Gloeobacterales cyanobacterium]
MMSFESRVRMMKTFSQAVLIQVAAYLQVLAEPMRLKILQVLRSSDRTVGEVVEAVEGNQANVSKHLRILLDAGIVSRRAEGTSAIYSIADPAIFDLCDIVCDRLAARIEAQHILRESLTRRETNV